jgi:RNA-dependent RNA polymerase
MINGLCIGDRHYEFLAFGNSQFREHGAYFIAPLPHFTAQRIRDWMGMFKDIKGVALYASRLGQCFSTTRAISGSRVEIKTLKDVKDITGRFCFTDGVGKISAFLAQLAASELGIDQSATGAPSLFQFRLGGCKGVLAVSPDAKMREIHIRPSQYKFPAKHEGLEIIRWSQFAAASLNRQLILILSALGVPDEIFIQKLKLQLSNLERAMKDEKVALALLQKDIDANQMTLNIAGMIVDGFFASREPFLTSLLRLWRAWSIKYLKEKAKILINDGALLLGCTDETGQLKGYRVPSQEIDATGKKEASLEEVSLTEASSKEASLPEIFVQLSKGPDDKPYVVQGPMLLARNPSLHPGDIRVVRGVDVPQLHHLKDVVVFPQNGDRDIPSMCSGGDLDGDDFLVMWDRDLLSHDWNQAPMDYTPPEKVAINREITINDITSFFVTYMKNDTLPSIAHAHVAQADFAEDGVKDEKCKSSASVCLVYLMNMPRPETCLASLDGRRFC